MAVEKGGERTEGKPKVKSLEINPITSYRDITTLI